MFRFISVISVVYGLCSLVALLLGSLFETSSISDNNNKSLDLQMARHLGRFYIHMEKQRICNLALVQKPLVAIELEGREAHDDFPFLENFITHRVLKDFIVEGKAAPNSVLDNLFGYLALLTVAGVSFFVTRWLLGDGSEEKTSKSGMDKSGSRDSGTENTVSDYQGNVGADDESIQVHGNKRQEHEKDRKIADLQETVEHLTRMLEENASTMEMWKKKKDEEIDQLHKEIEMLKRDYSKEQPELQQAKQQCLENSLTLQTYLGNGKNDEDLQGRDTESGVTTDDLKGGSPSRNTGPLCKRTYDSAGECNRQALGAKKRRPKRYSRDSTSDRPVSEYDDGQKFPETFQPTKNGRKISPPLVQRNLERAQRFKLKVNVKTFFVTRHGRRLDQEEEGRTLRGILRHYEGYVEQVLPRRRNILDYLRDTPLTISGIQDAVEVGRKMAMSGYAPVIYCSPAFRCVQTADAIAWGAGIHISNSLHIEPGLFEPFNSVPPFMTVQELTRDGYYNIAANYRPSMEVDSLKANETQEEFHCRQGLVTGHILRHASQMEAWKPPCVLIVGHAFTVGSVSHVLMSQPQIDRIIEQWHTDYVFHEVVTKMHHGWDRKFLPFFDEDKRKRILNEIQLYKMKPYSYNGWRFLADDEWE